MALIGKIRKNFWFVLLLLGLALAAFIVMDMTGSSSMSNGANPSVGSVEGEKIKYQDFQRTQSTLYSNSGADPNAVVQAVWDFYAEKAIIDKEAEALGIGVGFEELKDLQFGENLSPIIQNNFRNPQTGQLNRQNLLEFKNAIENGTFQNEGTRAFWYEQEKQIIKDQKQTKLNNMVSKAIYTPTWMVESNHNNDNEKIDIAFVKVPFDTVEDSDVEVTDSDLKAYLEDNAAKYEVEEETRVAEYVVFDVVPTATDSTKWMNEITEKLIKFASTENDSIFAVNNDGSFQNYFFKKSELPQSVQDRVDAVPAGSVSGAYIDGTNYQAFKVVEAKAIPDSVKASHILRSVDANVPGQMTAASNMIDSLLNLLETGAANFADLATAHSQDPGSGSKGGDLGYFVQNTMVPGFKDACFYYGKEGGYYKVTTRFGVHLIYIEDQKFLDNDSKYKVGYINVPIIPSEETQDSLASIVSDLAFEHRDIESLSTAIDEMEDVSMETSQAFKINDYLFGELGGGTVSRDAVRWLFDEDSDVGDVSPELYEYTDGRLYYSNKFMLLGLKEINKAGELSVDGLRSQIEGIVRNQKKGEKLIAELQGMDMSAIAGKYSTEIDTALAVSFNAGFNPNMGNEPDVIAKAFMQEVNSVSAPIIGEAGVFVAKTIARNEAPQLAGIPQFRSIQTTSARSSVPFRLIQSLKKESKIKDNRFKLNM